VRSNAYSSRPRQSKDRRKVARTIIGAIAVLVILFVVLPGELGTDKHPSQDQNTTTTTMSLSGIQSTYEAVLSEYNATLVASNAVITATGTDITTQEERIQNDAKTYNYPASGSGCSGNASDFKSCLADDQLTAQTALGDENAAKRTMKADVTEQIRSIQRIETAITAFVQPLDGITWPSSVSPVESDLTHTLDDERSTYVQVAADLASGKSFSTDSQTIATAKSAVVTQLTSMASALGVPPPSSATPS
jgi:hypothetical protein